MKLKRILIVSITIFLFACNSNISGKEVTIKEFPTKKEIKLGKYPFNIPPYQSDNVGNWEKRNVYYGRPVATTFFAFAVSEKYKKVYLISAKETDLDKIYVFDLTN
jgi:hypothetical protein